MVRSEIEEKLLLPDHSTYFPLVFALFRQTDLPDERAWCRNTQGLRVIIWIEWAACKFPYFARGLTLPVWLCQLNGRPLFSANNHPHADAHIDRPSSPW